jgi:hypothetical protein
VAEQQLRQLRKQNIRADSVRPNEDVMERCNQINIQSGGVMYRKLILITTLMVLAAMTIQAHRHEAL